MFLSEILAQKKKEVEQHKGALPQKELLLAMESLDARRNFAQAISDPHHIGLIAEIKRKSPSAGILCKNFDPERIARIYEANGAAAISVLTDENFFGGNLGHLKEAKKSSTLPILRKDFIIDEYQIYESAYYGADAILLIANILTEGEIRKFQSVAKDLGVGILVEVHSEEDMSKALSAKSAVIGINNRDLHTFKVDLETTSNLIRMIPEGARIVSESGIKRFEDVMFLKSLGVSAVLIGEAFMKSNDIGSEVRQVMGLVL